MFTETIQFGNNVYNAFTEGRARLFGYAINRKMEVIHNGTVAYMSLLESGIMRKMKNNHPHISSNMTLFIKLLSLYN